MIYTYLYYFESYIFHLTIYREHSSRSMHTDLILLNSCIIVHSVTGHTLFHCFQFMNIQITFWQLLFGYLFDFCSGHYIYHCIKHLCKYSLRNGSFISEENMHKNGIAWKWGRVLLKTNITKSLFKIRNRPTQMQNMKVSVFPHFHQ